jgi:hypothetical protein
MYGTSRIMTSLCNVPYMCHTQWQKYSTYYLRKQKYSLSHSTSNESVSFFRFRHFMDDRSSDLYNTILVFYFLLID